MHSKGSHEEFSLDHGLQNFIWLWRSEGSIESNWFRNDSDLTTVFRYKFREFILIPISKKSYATTGCYYFQKQFQKLCPLAQKNWKYFIKCNEICSLKYAGIKRVNVWSFCKDIKNNLASKEISYKIFPFQHLLAFKLW